MAVGLASTCFFFQFVIGPRAWLDLTQMRDQLTAGGAEGETLFDAMIRLESDGYNMWWGQQRRIGDFRSPREFGDWLAAPTGGEAGKDWFAIRKDVPRPTDGSGVTISAHQLAEELRRLYPILAVSARR